MEEFKRQCMRGKIAVMRKDWLLAYGVNVQGKIEKSRESNTRNLVGLRMFYNTPIWYGIGCRSTVICGGRARGAPPGDEKKEQLHSLPSPAYALPNYSLGSNVQVLFAIQAR